MHQEGITHYPTWVTTPTGDIRATKIEDGTKALRATLSHWHVVHILSADRPTFSAK